MKTLDVIVGILLIIGGLNWGFVGFFNYNLVEAIFAGAPVVTRVIYALVGLSALYEIFEFRSIPERWHEPAHGYTGV